MHIQSLVMCASKEPKIYWSYHPIACMLSRFRCVQLFATLWTGAHQAPLSMGFCRQEHLSGLPCPPLGIFLTRGLMPCLLHLSCIVRHVLYHWHDLGKPLLR